MAMLKKIQLNLALQAQLQPNPQSPLMKLSLLHLSCMWKQIADIVGN